MTQTPRASDEKYYTPAQEVSPAPIPAPSSHPPAPPRLESLQDHYGSSFHTHNERDSFVIDVDDPSFRRRSGRGGGYDGEMGAEGGRDEEMNGVSDRSMEIYWEDVRFSVVSGRGKSKKDREILKGVGGRVRPGEVCWLRYGLGSNERLNF